MVYKSTIYVIKCFKRPKLKETIPEIYLPSKGLNQLILTNYFNPHTTVPQIQHNKSVLQLMISIRSSSQ